MVAAPVSPPASSPWNGLLPTALAGTHRQPLAPLPGLTPALGAEAGAPEKQLLLTAASLCLVQRVGRRLASTAEALPHSEPAAPRRPLPAAAVALLLQTLPNNLDNHVCQDFLHRIYRAGYYVALADARPVLDALAGAGRARLLSIYPALLGRRGPWLAAAYPHPAIQAEAPWMTTRWLPTLPWEQQQSTLNHWRKMGPAAATEFRQLLPALRQPASRQELATLLHVLADGHCRLPAALQPLLETLAASEDAADYQLRHDARVLLAARPGYDPARRVGPVAAAYLHLETGPTGRHLRVQRPAAWQHAWEEAGLKRPTSYFDTPQNWLYLLLAATPPRRWLEAWGATPAEAIALALASEEPVVVLKGWLQASTTYGDVDFARALLALPGSPVPGTYWSDLLDTTPVGTYWPPLLAAAQTWLPAPEQLAWLQQTLPSLPPAGEWGVTPSGQLPHWVSLLLRVAGRTLALDQWLLAQVQAYATPPLAAAPEQVADLLGWLLRPVSQFADPALLPLVQAAAGRVDLRFAPLFQQVATDLTFRRDVAAALPNLPAA